MRIVVVGTGYVGLVTGSCFAEMGNTVLCLDADEGKIARLRQGQVPIHEPGLEPMIRRNVAAGRLIFSTSYDEAVGHGDVFFIAVGTPSDEDGSADLSHVVAAARSIGSRIDRPVLVVNKSTVPLGTADAVRSVFEKELTDRGLDFRVSVASNPEFLKEGAAVEIVRKVSPELGYLHSGFEKTGENKRYEKFIPYCDRMDYAPPMNNNLAYVLTVEKLLDVEIPEYAQLMRVICAELQRIGSHMIWLGTHAMDVRGTGHALVMYCFHMRERILDLFEMVCGARMTTSYFSVGGLRWPIPNAFLDATRAFLKEFAENLKEFEKAIKEANPEKGILFQLHRKGSSFYLSYKK